MRSASARRKLSATDVRNLRTLLLLSVFEGKEIGARIAQARNEKGLRQEDLAVLINVSTRSVQGYESGETSSYRHLKAISEVLGKPVEWLLHGDQPTTAPATLEEIRELRLEVAELRERVERVLALLLAQAGPRAEQERP